MSERRRRTTSRLGYQSFLFTLALIAILSYLSGCGPEQTDVGQTTSVPVSLNISMPQKSGSAASSSTSGSRFWATVQSWLPSITSAWAATTTDLRALTVEVTGPDIASPITATQNLSEPTPGDIITFTLDVPVGPDRVFTVSGLDASQVTIFQGESTPTTLTAGQPATVNITLVEILAITTPSLPNGTVGFTYLTSSEGIVTLSASGGAPPYTWSIVENLPPAPGLALSPSGATAGQITGQPTTAGTFTQTYRVQDRNGTAVTKSLTLTVNTQLTIDTTSPLPSGTVGQSYSFQLGASGGTPPYTWSCENIEIRCPGSGLQLSSSGLINGTPNAAISFPSIYRVQDSKGDAVTKPLTLNIISDLTITTTTLPDSISIPDGPCFGLPYLTSSGGIVTLSASGGIPPYTWSIVGGLTPAPGLSLSPSGEITRTLIRTDFFTTLTFTRTYRVRDRRGDAVTKPLTIRAICGIG